MLKTIARSFSAGLLIAIGGSAFLASENHVVGAFLFSVALLCICYCGFYLFTGKIGYAVDDHSIKNIANLCLILLGNLVTTCLIGCLLRWAIPSFGTVAEGVVQGKMEQEFLQTFIRGVFCGILMFLAVEIFQKKSTPLGIIFCIPVFIICGFEHSVADMFYFAVSGLYESKIIAFEIAAVLGNTVGGILVPLLMKVGEKNGKEKN